MKKLLQKDKKLRSNIQTCEKKRFVLKAVFKNLNYFALIRWNAFLKLKELSTSHSQTSLSNRCLYTTNKKRLNKLTTFSRHVFLKLIRSGNVHGIQKSS